MTTPAAPHHIPREMPASIACLAIITVASLAAVGITALDHAACCAACPPAADVRHVEPSDVEPPTCPDMDDDGLCVVPLGAQRYDTEAVVPMYPWHGRWVTGHEMVRLVKIDAALHIDVVTPAPMGVE